MIIKSLSRQNKSFDALYKYLTRDKDSLLRSFNLYAHPHDRKATTKEFLDNAKYLRKSRGKNYYYHEIISLAKNSLSSKEQEKILSDVASKYTSVRAESHLTFTALHTDKEHTHIHLMISANEIMGTKRVRLSKNDFSTIQKELEQYVNTIYPELEQTKHYDKDFSKFRSKKEELVSTLEKLFKRSTSKEDFEKYTKELNLEFYTRGKTTGVIFENKKHRLKTLGVDEYYKNLNKKFEQKPKEKETAPLNENEAKIKARREEISKARESRHTEARERSKE